MGSFLVPVVGFSKRVLGSMAGQPHDIDRHPGFWLRELESEQSQFSREVLLWRLGRISWPYLSLDFSEKVNDSMHDLVSKLIEMDSAGELPPDFFGDTFKAPIIKLWSSLFAHFMEYGQFEIVFPSSADQMVKVYAESESANPEPAMEVPETLSDAVRTCGHSIEAIGYKMLVPYLPNLESMPSDAEFNWIDDYRLVVKLTA
jgi:hypothetical protein